MPKASLEWESLDRNTQVNGVIIMGSHRSRVKCCSFRWPIARESRSRQVKGASKASSEPPQGDLDLETRSVDSEPYTPRALDLAYTSTELDFESFTPTALELEALRKMIGDEDSTGSDVDESIATLSPTSHDQTGAADHDSEDSPTLGYVTGQLRSLSADRWIEPIDCAEFEVEKSLLIQSKTSSPTTDIRVLLGATPTADNSGSDSVVSGYPAGGRPVGGGNSVLNSGYSQTAVSGLRYSTSSNSGGDLSSISSSKSLTSDFGVESHNTQDSASTDASTKSALLGLGPDLEHACETAKNLNSEVAVVGGRSIILSSTPQQKSGSSVPTLYSASGELVMNLSQDKAVVEDDDDDEDHNRGWYVHVSKTAQCIFNHYQLRPIMDELRHWSMQVPGTTNVRYRHINTGVEVALPWPDPRTGSEQQIQQFVRTVNKFEGCQVFYCLLKEHPKGFILSRPPPSPTSFRSSGLFGRANHRERRATGSIWRSQINGHLLLPPPSPAFNAPPLPTCLESGTIVEFSGANDSQTNASGSCRLITGLDNDVLRSSDTVPQNSHGVQRYLLYSA